MKKKREDVVGRLSIGELNNAGSELSIARQLARKEFMEAVWRLVPEALMELQESVLPVFLELVGARGGACDPLALYRDYEPAANAYRRGGSMREWERYRAIVAEFERWEAKYHLAYAWLRREICAELSNQAKDAERTTDQKLTIPFGSWMFRSAAFGDPLESEFASLQFEIERAWNPAGESWASFQQWALAEFKGHLGRYRESVQGLFELENWGRAPVKHSKSHFDIAARYIVRGDKVDDIAYAFGVDLQATKEALRSVSVLVGLDRRPTGRPATERNNR